MRRTTGQTWLCAVCFSVGGLLAQSRPAAQVTVTIDTTSHGYAIPGDFSGIGFERGTQNSGNAGASGYLFSPANTQLITLFQNLGLRSLRIGAGSVDTEIPVGTGSDGYTSVDNLFGFAKAAGVKVLYGVRLLNPASKPIPALQADDSALAQYVWQHYEPYVSYFSIGNEPDFRSYHTSTNHPQDPLIYETTSGVPGSAYPSYLADWRNFADKILSAAPGATFAGPDTGAYNNSTYTPNSASGVSWTQQFAVDGKSSGTIANATQHYYVGGSPGATTAAQAIGNMLSAAWVNNTAIGTQPAGSGSGTTTFTPYLWLYTNNLAPVLAAGVPYRLTESNDYLTGVPGASNGFASALWVLDYMHWWAAHGAAGVNFHNKQWIYTDTIVPSPNPCVGTCGNYQTAPKGYGIKAFDLGGHGYVEPVTIANPGGVNLTAYAVGDAQDVSVTLINKTQGAGATDATVTIAPNGFRAGSAQAMVLTDGQPGDASQMTATFGGASITNSGRWLGIWTPLAPAINGQITVPVQAATAAVVRIHAASAYGGPVQIDQNGAVEIFGTDSAGDTWHDGQIPSQVPNSASAAWHGWTDLQGGVASKGGTAVVKNLNNTLEIFISSVGGDVYHNWQMTPGGAWNGWADMGGNGITGLVAASNADGSLSIFGIGTNGDVWTSSQSAPGVGWSAWSDLSGVRIAAGFVVGQNLDGTLEICGGDSSGDVWYNQQTAAGGWSGWKELQGQVVSSRLGIGRDLDGRLELFGLAANGDLWNAHQLVPGGAWSGWSSLDAKAAGVPPGHQKLQVGFVVGQNSDGRLAIFGVGRGTRGVWTVSQQSPGADSWGGWADLGATNTDPQLVVSSTADGRIQLFGIGSNGDIWSNWQGTPGGQWTGWSDFGGSGLKFYRGQ